MLETGRIVGLTFRQAAEVIHRATGNDVAVNPFDAYSIERAALAFGDNNAGSYPHLVPREGGGFDYVTISGRELSVYPDPEGKGWTLDCSSWWAGSRNFRAVVLECLKDVLADERFRDASLPEPEPQHIHGGEELIGERFVLDHTPVNNHGCSGFWIRVEATSSTEGLVVGGGSCSSCWQEGHVSPDSPIPIGSRVRLPEGWCWLCASQEDLEFRSSRDVSRNGRTMVTPYDVTIVEDDV